MRDASQRSHRAGNDDHRVGRIGSAGKGRVHAFESMRLDAFGEFQAAGKFFRDDLMRVMAHHDVDFVLARIEIVEQTLGVKRPAGSGDGNKNSQASELWRGEDSGARFP